MEISDSDSGTDGGGSSGLPQAMTALTLAAQEFNRRPRLDATLFQSMMPDVSFITQGFEDAACLVDTGISAYDGATAAGEAQDADREDDNEDDGDEDRDGDDGSEAEEDGADEEVNAMLPDDGDEPDPNKEMSQEELTTFLQNLNADIVERQNTAPLEMPPNLLMQPYPRQLRAAAMIRNAVQTDSKGVMLADSMGGGKTISGLLGIQACRVPGQGPCVYVCPPSTCIQVKGQTKALFGSTMRVLHLDDRSTGPELLFEYDIIIVSYHFLRAEWQAEARFFKAMKAFKEKLAKIDKEIAALRPEQDRERSKLMRQKTQDHPRRPRASLVSEIFMQPGVRKIGPLLVLDEAQLFKNLLSTTYKTVQSLRNTFEAVAMMSGTPMDNTWLDVCSMFSLLKNYNIVHHGHMRAYFTTLRVQRSGYAVKRPDWTFYPRSQRYLDRLRQAMDAPTLRRPDVAPNVPLVNVSVKWTASKEDLAASNKHWDSYKKANSASKGASKGKKPASTPKAPASSTKASKFAAQSSGDETRPWSHLIKAHYALAHPRLAEIYDLAAKAYKKQARGDAIAADQESTEEDQKELDEFLAKMQLGDAYRSRKVDTAISLIRRLRDEFPEDGVLFFDDNIYLLDLVRIGLRKQAIPVRVEIYSGRLDAVKRDALLQTFKKEKGFRVLLCTPGAAGVGLNLQWANHVVRTGPWWKGSAELQALCRSWRDGQTKTVYHYEMFCIKSKLDGGKEKVRDGKTGVVTKIYPAIERGDNVRLPVGQPVRVIT